MTGPLLHIEDLCVYYRQRGWHRPPVRAVDGVSMCVGTGETVGLVGESGSGKSTIGRAVLGLVQPTGGRILLDGHERTRVGRYLPHVVQAVFQDPYSSLNPSRTVGRTLAEPLETRSRRADAEQTVTRLLDSVSLPTAAAHRYPHSFSGGQRQRIAIARALATNPKLIVCDEALSALDLVTQARALNLLRHLQAEHGMSLLFIAHNLPVVANLAHRVVVLYRGRVMEQGCAAAVHDQPLHPYSRALLAAVPLADPIAQAHRRHLRTGTVESDAADPSPQGCPFAARCRLRADVCRTTRPADTPIGDRTVACHLFDPRSGHPEAGNPPPQNPIHHRTENPPDE